MLLCLGRLPKRGAALPPEATITPAELRTVAEKAKCEYGALPLISLSHFWRTKEHPDPDGVTLECAAQPPNAAPPSNLP